MEFSRPEYWSGLPFPSPWDRPDPAIESESPTLQADPLLSEPPGKNTEQESLKSAVQVVAGATVLFVLH